MSQMKSENGNLPDEVHKISIRIISVSLTTHSSRPLNSLLILTRDLLVSRRFCMVKAIQRRTNSSTKSAVM